MASRVEVLKFLASAFNMVKKGDIKSLQDLFNFAKQQFGQVDDKLSKQIIDTFGQTLLLVILITSLVIVPFNFVYNFVLFIVWV